MLFAVPGTWKAENQQQERKAVGTGASSSSSGKMNGMRYANSPARIGLEKAWTAESGEGRPGYGVVVDGEVGRGVLSGPCLCLFAGHQAACTQES